jgi:hypothetical protein
MKSKSIVWIYVAVLVFLYLISLYWLGYEHFNNPNESIGGIILNLFLISIPLILLYGAIGLILFAIRQKSLDGKINTRISRFLYYTPRIAGVLMIIFVALFALDMFGGNKSFWQQLLGFVIHAAPSIILAILMFFAWRKPVIGFVVFGLAAVLFLRFVFGSSFGPGNFVMFVAPMAVISAMFWINWKWGDVIRLKPQG